MAKDIFEKSAIQQRDGKSYAIVPRIACGHITDFNILRTIADVAQKYHASAIKITSAQRLAIIGITEENIDSAMIDLGMEPGFAIGLCVRSVKACPGNRYCRVGQQDALALGEQIETRFSGKALPNKLKIAVSGCPICCAESWVRDIGLIGSREGYSLVVGGAAGANPRIAQLFAEKVPAESALPLISLLIDGYLQFGTKRRLGQLIAKIGLDTFRTAILEMAPPDLIQLCHHKTSPTS